MENKRITGIFVKRESKACLYFFLAIPTVFLYNWKSDNYDMVY